MSRPPLTFVRSRQAVAPEPEQIRKTNPESGQEAPVRQHGLTPEYDAQLLAKQEKQRRRAARGPENKQGFLKRAADGRARKRHTKDGWWLVSQDVADRAEAIRIAANEREREINKRYEECGRDPSRWWEWAPGTVPAGSVTCDCGTIPGPHRPGSCNEPGMKFKRKEGDVWQELKRVIRERKPSTATAPVQSGGN